MTVDFAKPITANELQSFFSSAVNCEQISERRVELRFPQHTVSSAEIVKNLCNAFEIVDLTVLDPTIDEVIMKMYSGKGKHE